MKPSNPKNGARISALNLLEKQLKNGTKPAKIDGKTTNTQIPLTEKDISRIKKEIDILKSKIVLLN